MLVTKILKNPIIAHLFYLSLIVGAGLLVYRDVVLSKGPAMQYNDNAGVFYPALYFAKHSILEGEFPLWDPHQLFGQPLAFNTYSLLYPPVLFLLSLPTKEIYPRCMELLIVSHLILAGVMMYFGSLKLGFSKRAGMISGTIFVIAPSTNNYVFNPPAAFLLAWAPLIVAFTIYILQSSEEISLLKKEFLILFAAFFLAITAVSLPVLVFVYMTLGIIFIFYLLESLLRGFNFLALWKIVKKFLIIIFVPLILTSFLWFPLLTYSQETARITPAPQHAGLGPLYSAHIYTLLFPMFAYGISDSYAYIGIMTFFLILISPLIFSKKQNLKLPALFSFLAGFWFFFAIQNSPLYEEISALPILNSLRFSYRALVFFVMFSAWFVGILLDNLLIEKKKEKKDSLISILKIMTLILPITLLYCLFIARNAFDAVQKVMPLSETNEPLPLYFVKKFHWTIIGIGLLIILYLLNRYKKLPKILLNLFWIIPFAVIVSENIMFYSINPKKSWEARMNPYKEWAKQFLKKLPEIGADKGLFRVETFGNEQAIFPYYLDYYSVNGVGYIPQGTHPISYYLLWSDDAAWYGSTYQKPTPDTISTTISVNSPLYKLMGVKYFASLNIASRVIPFKDRGTGEYIEVFFKEDKVISGIKIVQPKDVFKRRITKARIYADRLLLGEYDVKNEAGPQIVRFRPTTMQNIKVEALEVSLNAFPQGDGWVVEDISFLDINGKDIPIEEIKEVKPSSTFFLSSERFLTDGLPTEWESDNLINTKKMAEKDGFIYVRNGLSMAKDYFPRAFFTCNYEIVTERNILLEKLHNPNFDPKTLLIYQPQGLTDISKTQCFNSAEITKYGHNRVSLEITNENPGFLVLTDNYSNGWKVFVDGKRQNIFKAYGIFRAVEITDSGKHTILFIYTPPNFYKGLILSLVTLSTIIYFGIKKTPKLGIKLRGH